MKSKILNHNFKWFEIAFIVLIFGIAITIRLWRLDQVPAGLHYDEAIDLKQGLRILAGERPVFVQEGWGREALYYYLVALILSVVSSNFMAIRIAVVVCSLGTMLTIFVFTYRMFCKRVALIASAWFAVLFWPVFAGRFGVRGMSLPLVLGVAVLAFWLAWEGQLGSRIKLFWYIVAGVLFGLTFYTYQPARFTPAIFLIFAIYLFFFHRTSLKQNMRGLLFCSAVCILVTLPLMGVIFGEQATETDRYWAIEPLLQLFKGNPDQILANTVAVLKMFSVAGDPLASYNLPDRPVFVPTWTSVVFYGGVVLALVRWRRPLEFFLLTWLFVMLLPSVVTVSAPNFNRLVGALAPMVILSAFFMIELIEKSSGRHRHLSKFLFLLYALVLFLTVRHTWSDYFIEWPKLETSDIQYNASIHKMAQFLESSNSDLPAVISSRNIEDADPYILDAILDKNDLSIRWADATQAFVIPSNAPMVRLFLSSNRWIDQDLSAFFNVPATPQLSNDYYSVFEIAAPSLPSGQFPYVYQMPRTLQGFPSEEMKSELEVELPISFEDDVTLNGIYLLRKDFSNGDYVVLSAWRVQRDGKPAPIAIFVHLLNEAGAIVGQYDGLGFPPHSWHAGDEFYQVHRIQTDSRLLLGSYWLQIGLYNRSNGQRWMTGSSASGQLSDRLLVGPLEIVDGG